MPSAAEFWDSAAEKYAQSPIRDPEGYRETLDRLRSLLLPHHHVLELGCGTGSTALDLAGGVSGYLGTDISGEMIRIARNKLDDKSPERLRFEVGTAGAPPEDGHDVVLALNLLHLLPDLDDALSHIHQSLPAGGLLIAKTVLLKQSRWYISLLLPVLKLLGKAPPLVRLSDREVIAALEKAGFEVTETLAQPGIVHRIFTVAKKP